MLAGEVDLVLEEALAEGVAHALQERRVLAHRAEGGLEAELRHHHAVAEPEVVGSEDHDAVGLLARARLQALVRGGVVAAAAPVVEVRRHDADDRRVELGILGLGEALGHEPAELLGHLRLLGLVREHEASRRLDRVHLRALERLARGAPEVAHLVELLQHLDELRLDVRRHLEPLEQRVEPFVALERVQEPHPLLELALHLLLAGSLQRHHEGLRGQPERVDQDQQGDVPLVPGLVLRLGRRDVGGEAPQVGALEVLGKGIEAVGHGNGQVYEEPRRPHGTLGAGAGYDSGHPRGFSLP